MRTIPAALCFIVVTLLITVLGRISFASDPTHAGAKVASAPSVAEANPEVPAAHDPIAAEYERLGLEFEKLAAAQEEVLPLDTNEPADLTLPDDEWLKQRRAAQAKAPNPDTLLPRFLAFATNHADSPLAFDAVFLIARRSCFQEFRGDGEPSPVLTQALDLAWADHKEDPRMVHLLEIIAIPSRQSEMFLKRAIDEAPNRTVRAAATFNLARYYRFVAGCYKKTQRITDTNDTALTNEDRMWKLVVVPNLEKYLPLDKGENSKRTGGQFDQVVAEFSDVTAAGWKMPGPGNVYVESVPRDPPQTYGDEAAAILYKQKHLSPGNPAPETVGQDADGKTFRLSDYRDHVVLLTFCAEWCPGCVQLYPIERRLQEKFRGQPFVILSVNCDESLETLKSHIAAGDITWRCWWDGRRGPIRSAWHTGLPGVTLLNDKHIIQDSNLGPNNTAEEFEQTIAPLVKSAAAGK